MRPTVYLRAQMNPIQLHDEASLIVSKYPDSLDNIIVNLFSEGKMAEADIYMYAGSTRWMICCSNVYVYLYRQDDVERVDESTFHTEEFLRHQFPRCRGKGLVTIVTGYPVTRVAPTLRGQIMSLPGGLWEILS